jgi:integrase
MSIKLPKSGKAVAKQNWAKTDIRYWEAAVFKPRFSRRSEDACTGQNVIKETKHYSVRISHQGQRHTIPLVVANKSEAARKARDIYLSLISTGWRETHEKFHPRHINRLASENSQTTLTVGQFLEEVQALSGGLSHRSITGYIASLRMIAADVAGIKSDASRYDHKKGGRDAWAAKVDAVPLSRLTPSAIEQWKHRFVRKRKGNPVEERKARNSANSFIRQARSLFAPKIIKHIGGGIELHDPLPFHEVALFPRSSMRYVSRIDIHQLVSNAREELGAPRRENETVQSYGSRTEQFKIFLLAAFGGLRRNEIDKLLWEQLDLDKGIIEIRETTHFKPKSEDSRGLIQIEPEVASQLARLKDDTKQPFVIAASMGTAKSKSAQWYRSQRHFDDLLAWLRAKGINDQKPLHVLRKEAGSLVCNTSGLHAASRFLRHADVRVTAEHYLDTRTKVTVGMGSLLGM